jgi:hypothetical protein
VVTELDLSTMQRSSSMCSSLVNGNDCSVRGGLWVFLYRDWLIFVVVFVVVVHVMQIGYHLFTASL